MLSTADYIISSISSTASYIGMDVDIETGAIRFINNREKVKKETDKYILRLDNIVR